MQPLFWLACIILTTVTLGIAIVLSVLLIILDVGFPSIKIERVAVIVGISLVQMICSVCILPIIITIIIHCLVFCFLPLFQAISYRMSKIELVSEIGAAELEAGKTVPPPVPLDASSSSVVTSPMGSPQITSSPIGSPSMKEKEPASPGYPSE